MERQERQSNTTVCSLLLCVCRSYCLSQMLNVAALMNVWKIRVKLLFLFLSGFCDRWLVFQSEHHSQPWRLRRLSSVYFMMFWPEEEWDRLFLDQKLKLCVGIFTPHCVITALIGRGTDQSGSRAATNTSPHEHIYSTKRAHRLHTASIIWHK